MNNLKKDAIRKVAAEVRKLALVHRCDVVLVEDLEYFTQSIHYEKGTNSLLSLWSPNAVLKWITNALEPHGIPMIRIDPRSTSKIDPRTGQFGFNEFKAAKEILLVERNGQLEIIDADIAAACNLQRRFWMRNSDIFRLECYPDEAGFVPIVEDSATGIRICRYFESILGSKHATIHDGLLVPVTSNQYKALLDRAREAKSERLYRHGDKWLTFSDHTKEVDSLFDQFTDQAPDSETARKFIDRVKSFQTRKLRAKA